jgi:hypothetical protein
MGDISVLMCFLLGPAERRVALSRITPCIPNNKVERIWEGWSSHLEHEKAPAPHGATARTFFLNILISSPANAGEHAEVETLLHLYVTDAIKESILRTHTIGAPQDEPMPQSSSKRGRDENGDTEDTATYPGQSATHATEAPTPHQTPPPGALSMDTPILTPLQLREEARIAFLAQPMLLVLVARACFELYVIVFTLARNK